MRSKDFRSEGTWEDVDVTTIELRNAQLRSIRKNETKELNKKRRSTWDQSLDAGRVKKIKDKSKEDSFSKGPSAKDFQAIQDKRQNERKKDPWKY